MKETRKTKAQLLSELEELRQRIGEFEGAEIELKRAEKTLQQSEERFRSLVETTTDWFWEVDENAVYTYSSPKIRDILGYEPEEILGKTPFSLMPPEEADRVAHIFAPYAKSRRLFELLENINVHKDGHLVVLETSGIPIFDAKGVFRGYRGIDRDITERKQAEQAIRASEMRLRTAIESLPFDFFIIDKDGRYVMQNSTCRDRWGDVIGKRTEDLEVDEDNLTLWLNNNRRAFAGEVISDEVELKVRGGIGFFYNIIAPVTDGDQVREILGVNIDITDRKRAEEELRKAHDEMEQKVKERTSELLETNEQLRREIENRKRVEERLRESEVYIKGILNAAPAGIGLVRKREFDWVSDRMCEMLGYSADELLGQSARIAYESAEEFERVGRVKYSEIQERGVGSVETRFKRKDGSVLDILLCSSAVDPGDLSKGVIFTVLDITERKQVEEALRESQEKYRLLVDTMPSIVYKGYKDWSVEFLDEKIEVLTGHRMKEFNSGRMKWSELVVEEDIAGARETFIRALKTDKSYVREYRIKAKNGGVIWIQERASILCDDEGEIDYVSGVFFDITERKRAEEALRASEERHRMLLEASPDPIAVYDMEGKATYVSPAFVETFGWSSQELLGKHIEFVPEENWPETRAAIAKMLRGEKIQSFETRRSTKDGRILDIQLSSSVFHDRDDNLAGNIVILRDVTKRKWAEDALRKSEAELVAQTRHLEEVNAALKVLLKQREEDKADLEERLLANVKELVLPYAEKLKNSGLHSDQMTLVGILESNMKEIVSPFVTKLSSRFLSLTPTEIQVASLIKDGKTSKEIASLIHASENTVRSHRFHIRSKLGIKNKKVNLRSYLKSLQD
jgi:PAS domain S-box-containing protein